MGHGPRLDSQCVGEETQVLIKKGKSSAIVSELITNIQCVFTERPNETNKHHHFYDPNNLYDGDTVVNLTGGESVPLFIYRHKFKGEDEKLYEITVELPKELGASKFATLTATDWHPIMKNETDVTVASLLEKNDDVLVKVSDQIGAGKVIIVNEVDRREVVGLALGKVGADLKEVQRLLEAGEAYWNDFGLNVLENIIFMANTEITEMTPSIASGTLAFQYQLRSVIKHGIKLDQIRAVEAVIAQEHGSEHSPIEVQNAKGTDSQRVMQKV